MNVPLVVVCTVYLLLLVGWIVGEAKNRRAQRVICVAGLLIGTGAIAALISGLMSSFETSVQLTTAINRFIVAANAQIEADNAQLVHRQLGLLEYAGPTYESGLFIEQMRSATKRLE